LPSACFYSRIKYNDLGQNVVKIWLAYARLSLPSHVFYPVARG
jgi:hypothetical protein